MLPPNDALLAQVINATSEAVVCVDQRQVITFFNDGASHVFGWKADEVVGKKLETLLPARYHAAHRAHVRNFAHAPVAARRMAERSSVVGVRKDGTEFPADASIVKVSDEGSTVYAVILRDVSVEREASVVNQRLLVDMQRALQARDDLLGLVSHDLRNPVNAVRMLAAAIVRSASEDPDVMPPTVAEHANVMLQAASQMDALIQDLLDVTRIEAGRLRVAVQPVDPSVLVLGALETMRPLGEASGVAIVSEVANGLPLVQADPDRVAQVLSNLVGNALRFTPRGGRIWVTAAVHGDAIEFAVHDNGGGISKEELPFVFDRFWQAKRTNRSGAGLGLTITRGIVLGHGGQIWITSEPGEGTVVNFTLPIAPGG